MIERSRATLRALSLLAAFCTLTSVDAAHAEGAVNIYSYREPKLVDPVLKAFTGKTGIKVNVVFANSGLVERLSAEGRNSPADVLLTNEFGLLVQAVNAGVTAPLAHGAALGKIRRHPRPRRISRPLPRPDRPPWRGAGA